MSTAAASPNSISVQLSSPAVFDDDDTPHLDAIPSNTSYSSSPESRPVDPRTPISEADEDETSSEAANEPLTPTDPQHLQTFQHVLNECPRGQREKIVNKQPPLILNTSATPPLSVEQQVITPTPASEPRAPKTFIVQRPTLSSKDGGIKRVISGFFRRTNSQSGALNPTPLSHLEPASTASDTMLGKDQGNMAMRGGSASNSLFAARSITPPSPGTPSESGRSTHLLVKEPSGEELFDSRKKPRSSTNFGLLDRLQKHRISFAPTNDLKTDQQRLRATSVDLASSDGKQPKANKNEVHEMTRQVWGMAAETGIGLKSRRMSLNLPDDFTVDVVDLYSEYSDQSKLLGRRGKSVGKGATANVRLMQKKGGYAGEVYAVKEFRGKSTNEAAEEYEKKVKSEYSIAKAARHPNIVETIRLCTHHGRWNHVMEFCDQGDLFSLVNQRYLAKEDRLVDRLCIFKQLIQGLNYLHNNGIAHRDVKLENLLITKDSKLKITDFGVSEVFAGIHPGLRSADGQCGRDMQDLRLCEPGICGSPPYIAPEVIAKQGRFPLPVPSCIVNTGIGKYDPRPLDVWGAAIVMLCMTANGCLWDKAVAGSSALYDDLVNGWNKWNAKHSDYTDVCITESDYPHVKFFDTHIHPPALRRLLLAMLNPDPTRRATMGAISSNRWLKNVECCQKDSYEDTTTVIDASKSQSYKKITKIANHNHLPPASHFGHKVVRLPGSTDMR
jgi:protein-serine/threonine kinase